MWAEVLLGVTLAMTPVIETTPEGDTLVAVPDNRVALVGVRLALPVGRLSPWWWSHDAAAAWHLPLTDAPLAERIDGLMSLTLSEDDWSTGLSAQFRTGDLDRAVSALQDFLTADQAPRAALRSWHAAGRGPWDVPRNGMQVLVARMLLDPHDLRRQPAPPPPRRIVRLHRTRAALLSLPGRMIGVSGNVTVKQAREIAATLLPPAATAQPEGVAPAPLPVPATGGERAGWLPGGGQGAVVLARGSLAEGDADLPALLVALHALAGGVRSRLLTGLRHEAGLIYTLSASDGVGPAPGLLTVTIPARASQLSQTGQRTRAILADFVRSGITPDEQRTAVRALRQEATPTTPDEALRAAMEALRHRLPPDHRQTTLDEAEALSISEINTFIAAFFSPDAVAMLRVLPSPGLPSSAP